ncbi:MAG TPA: DUF2865 domain-containing protein [Xanthobacteraceae bacterium]|nr:DUF2865 domain-containing protein [Xanthobacteraceae bacterium]
MVARYRRGLGAAAAALLLALPLVTLSPQPVAAQGFFQGFFGNFERPRQRVYAPPHYDERLPVTSYAPDAPRYHDERFPVPDFSRRSRRPSHDDQPQRRSVDVDGIRGASSHCVRLCDGRYFPVPRSANGTRVDPSKVCAALCPATKTKVFNGSNIEYAAAADGTRYSDLDSAFVFREKIVDNCSCTGHGPGGLAQIDIASDPTLKAGDLVVTASGPTIFRGSKHFPYKTADFTPIDDYGRVNKELRRKLAGLKVNMSAKPVLPPQKLVAAAKDEQQPRARTRRPRVQTTENTGSAPREYRYDSFRWW